MAKIWMAHLLDVTKKQRGIYIALIFKQRFHRFIKVRGNTVPDRILVTAKNIFKFSAFAVGGVAVPYCVAAALGR